jgi:hypothetical protein
MAAEDMEQEGAFKHCGAGGFLRFSAFVKDLTSTEDGTGTVVQKWKVQEQTSIVAHTNDADCGEVQREVCLSAVPPPANVTGKSEDKCSVKGPRQTVQ